jgi:hypothetical protein
MKRPYGVIAAIVLFFSAVVILLVSRWLTAEVNAFRDRGVTTMVRILGFREVSSGDTGTRTIALAEIVTDGEDDAVRDIAASHILMDEITEVGSLRHGQKLEVIVLPDGEFSMTPPGYTHWFVTRRSLDRHLRNSLSQWGWNSAVVLTVLSLLLWIRSGRK